MERTTSAVVGIPLPWVDSPEVAAQRLEGGAFRVNLTRCAEAKLAQHRQWRATSLDRVLKQEGRHHGRERQPPRATVASSTTPVNANVAAFAPKGAFNIHSRSRSRKSLIDALGPLRMEAVAVVDFALEVRLRLSEVWSSTRSGMWQHCSVTAYYRRWFTGVFAAYVITKVRWRTFGAG